MSSFVLISTIFSPEIPMSTNPAGPSTANALSNKARCMVTSIFGLPIGNIVYYKPNADNLFYSLRTLHLPSLRHLISNNLIPYYHRLSIKLHRVRVEILGKGVSSPPILITSPRKEIQMPSATSNKGVTLTNVSAKAFELTKEPAQKDCE